MKLGSNNGQPFVMPANNGVHGSLPRGGDTPHGTLHGGLPSGGGTPCVQDITHDDATDLRDSGNKLQNLDSVFGVRNIDNLRKNLQIPTEGPFQQEDLTWCLKQTSYCEKQKEVQMAIISWEILPDFIKGEQSNRGFPCTFTKETLQRCLPETIQYPRGNSASSLVNMAVADELTDKRRKAKVHDGKTKKDSTEPDAELDAEPDAELDIQSDAELDAAPLSQAPKLKKTPKWRMIRKSEKRDCMFNFIARQVYLDNSLFEVQYYHLDHTNIRSERCHGVSDNVVPIGYLKPSSPKKKQHEIVQAGCEHDIPTVMMPNQNINIYHKLFELSDLEPSDVEPSVPSNAKSKLQVIHELFTSVLDSVMDNEVLRDQLQ